VTVNAALMRARHNRRRPAARESDLDTDGLYPRFDATGHHAAPVPAWADAPERAIAGETRAAVRAAIDRLPAAYREVLVLRDIEEMDTDEAAVLLRTTPGNVKTRLHRARAALRELLAAEMVGP
ncbi:MAG TPA: sigma-70 family RNA polymerase sigma factor, partial [Humisphaera sp.]